MYDHNSKINDSINVFFVKTKTMFKNWGSLLIYFFYYFLSKILKFFFNIGYIHNLHGLYVVAVGYTDVF